MVNQWLQDIDLKSFKGMLWDLDNTIYLYDPAHRAAFTACCEAAHTRYSIDPEEFRSAWKSSREKVHNDLHGHGASHSRLLYLQKSSERIFGHTDPEFTLYLDKLYWDVFLEHMIPRPGISELLEMALDAGLKMCIVTDLTTEVQLRKWVKLGLGRYFTHMVSSEEAGIEKPGPYMFQLALEKLELNASEVLMIGDSFEKDIRGAEGLGIKTIFVSDEKGI